MLRKTLSFVLVLALALSLVGCGGAASSSTPASISTTSTNSASGNVDGSDAEPVTLHEQFRLRRGGRYSDVNYIDCFVQSGYSACGEGR